MLPPHTEQLWSLSYSVPGEEDTLGVAQDVNTTAGRDAIFVKLIEAWEASDGAGASGITLTKSE